MFSLINMMLAGTITVKGLSVFSLQNLFFPVVYSITYKHAFLPDTGSEAQHHIAGLILFLWVT